MINVYYVIWKFRTPKKFLEMGGAEKQLLKTIEVFKNRTDIKMTIYSQKIKEDPINEQYSKNITIKRVKTTKIPFLNMLIFSFKLLFFIAKNNKREKIDIIHLPLPDIYITVVYLIKKLYNIPYISRIAADELFPFRTKGLWLINRLVTRFFIMKSNGVQVLNTQAKKTAENLNIEKSKIFLIPNGTELPVKKKNYSKLSNIILYIGALRCFSKKQRKEQKNIKFLIDSFNEIIEENPSLKLYLVGDGNYRKKLEDYVNMLELSEKVFFEGYQLDIEQYILNADIFVNPSFYEGLPNTVIEAMSYGIYVLCSDIPEHKFLIKNEMYGGLFPLKSKEVFKEKVKSFYKNPNYYFEVATKAREYVKKEFSIMKTTSKILKMYKCIISSKNQNINNQ